VDEIGPSLAFGGREFLPAGSAAEKFALLVVGHREQQADGLQASHALISGQALNGGQHGLDARTIGWREARQDNLLLFGRQVEEPREIGK
jgi:hypothetical protein